MNSKVAFKSFSNVDCFACNPKASGFVGNVPKGSCCYIHFTISPNPKLNWPDKPEMILYCGEQLGILFGSGVWSGGARTHSEAIRDTDWDGNCLNCFAKFNSLKEARGVYERAIAGGFVDIYLYDKSGLLVAKLD